jgi:hypothetical protein
MSINQLSVILVSKQYSTESPALIGEDIQLLISPRSLMVFLPPLYNQLSNEHGKDD